MALARIAEAKHEFTEAIDLAQQVLETSPNNEDAQALLATSYLAIGETEEAHQKANHLVEQLPTFLPDVASARLNLASSEAEISDFEAI